MLHFLVQRVSLESTAQICVISHSFTTIFKVLTQYISLEIILITSSSRICLQIRYSTESLNLCALQPTSATRQVSAYFWFTLQLSPTIHVTSHN